MPAKVRSRFASRISLANRAEPQMQTISGRSRIVQSRIPGCSWIGQARPHRSRVVGGAADRAFEVQMLLADRGQHRATSIPDLLIAATAEKAGLTVLAVGKDYDLIAEIDDQHAETLPPL